MSGTALDAAVTALAAVYTAAAPSGWVVVDGQPYDPPERFLAVGWDRSGQPAAVARRSVSDFGMSQFAEQYDVTCLLSAWAGTALTPAERTAVCTAFDTFDAALAADRRLGGTVAAAWASQVDYVPNFQAEGALAEIRFTVSITDWQ